MKNKEFLKDIRSKDDKAIFAQFAHEQDKLLALRHKASFKKIKNYREIRLLRRRIAQIWTILSERAVQHTKDEQ